MNQNTVTSAAKALFVTAFFTPQSILQLDMYSDNSLNTEKSPVIVTVGVYMNDRTIARTCNFTNAANALNYAFMLKGENCPISKNAFALLKAEIKRSGAISTRAAARAAAKAKTEVAQVHDFTPEASNPVEAGECETKVERPKKTRSPFEKEYKAMKQKHPDAVLLFRIGDFYECFHQDAEVVSEILGITLAYRQSGRKKVALAGFPHHALDTYLSKLVRAGQRVAICEYPKKSRKAV